MSFKSDFLWGSASAAYQIEGAHLIDGKGPSIWDEWAHIPGKTFEGTNGDIACDHYHRFKEDIELMKEMGLKTYRFSISWPRILPQGKGEINELGIDFYNQLIDSLIEANIVPMVTLYHWDLPLALEREYGGWVSRQIVDDFNAYAALCFERFGDRVPYWIVMNEPNIFTGLGYQLRLHPPGICDEATYLKAFHHTVLAHARAVKTYKAMGLGGQIGSSIAYSPAHAATDSPQDQGAKAMYEATGPYWFLDSYFKGEYPGAGQEYFEKQGVWQPISPADARLMQEGATQCDFIGINYYQTAMVAYNPPNGVGFSGMNTSGKKGSQSENGVPGLYKHVRNEDLDYTDWDWAIDPNGLELGLNLLHQRFGLPIVISENGLGAYDTLIDQKGETLIDDSYRIDFIAKHLLACERAMDAGVKLLAYCTWSFTDLLSWLNGYKKRYGFVYIDFENQTLDRYKKKSFYWYKQVIATNGACLHEKSAILTFDIGGTMIKSALVTQEGKILGKTQVPTPLESYDHLLGAMDQSKQVLCSQFESTYSDLKLKIEGVALSQPCATDAASGLAISEGALVYILNQNPAKDYASKLQVPFSAENDGNCAALAEVWLGAAKDLEHIALVVSGTGIGGAVVINRQIHHGHKAFAGEFGMCFTGVDDRGEPVTWSINGSTLALVKSYAQHSGKDPASLDGKAVFALADQGDALAQRVVTQFFDYFAIGLHNIQHVYDPQLILIGGGISGRQSLCEEIEGALDRLYSRFDQVMSRPQIALCQFGQDANLIGAAYHFIRLQK